MTKELQVSCLYKVVGTNDLEDTSDESEIKPHFSV